jgi:hypothetical protein
MIRAADLPSFPRGALIRDALLLLLNNEGGKDCELWADDTYEPLAARLELAHSANHSEWQNRVRAARARLVDEKCLHRNVAHGLWKLTRKGRDCAERLMAKCGRPAFERNRFSSGAFGLRRKQERPSKFRRTGERPTSQPGTNGNEPQFTLKAVGVNAIARELDGGLVVLKGSTARRVGTVSFPAARRRLRDQLVKDGELISGSDRDTYLFATDVPFKSQSAAASVVMACSVSGPSVWKVFSTGKS